MEILKTIKDIRWIYRSEYLRACKFTGKMEYKDISGNWEPVITEEYVEYIQQEFEDELDND